LSLQKAKCNGSNHGKEDIITDGKITYIVRNGHEMMAKIVGTGCMAASMIGTFAAVDKDYAKASACGLSCFEIAAESAQENQKASAHSRKNCLTVQETWMELLQKIEQDRYHLQMINICRS
jgi:hydroxyethylthiazole kinase-like sugar kinase family protein